MQARTPGRIDILQRLWRETRNDLRELRRNAAAGFSLLQWVWNGADRSRESTD
jgi:hypothetical protein